LNNNIYDIWFTRIEISNGIKLKLIEKYSSHELWKLKEADFKKENLEDKTIKKILDIKYRKHLNKYYEYMEKNDVKLINFKDNEYPINLTYIKDKPCYIHVRGNINILYNTCIAIIGSRNASEYGKNISRKIAKELADKNVNIISGLAIGIDKYAHLGCLDSNVGKTIAVVGTGLTDNDVYPSENKKVFERILSNDGCIVSEYVIGTEPKKHHFPMRNRIISGLADKIVIVEAGKKSGSLITVEYALEQGKDIFAVPGSILAQNSVGTNALIKDGAYLLDNIEELL